MAMTYNKEYIPKDRMVMGSGPRDRQLKQQMQRQASVQVDNQLVAELKEQIEKLQDKLISSGKGEYTADQVNDIVAKAIIEETKKLKQELEESNIALSKSKNQISLYEDNNKKLLEELSSKDKERNEYGQKLNKLNEKIKLFEKDIEILNEKISKKDDIISKLQTATPQIDNKLTDLLSEATKKIDDMAEKIKVYEHTVTGSVTVENDRPKMEAVFVDPIEKESSVEKFIDIEDVSTHKKEQMSDKVNKLKNLLGSLPSKR